MKKLCVYMLALLGLISCFGLVNVNAKSAPSSITMKSKSSLYYFTEKKGTDYISGYNFYRKELTDGTLGYCVSNINTSVPAGKTLKLKGEITDKGLDYIIKNGYPNKSFTKDEKKDYYITQSAIWEYYDETRGSNNWKSTKFDSNSTGMKAYVYTLVQGAKKANKASEVVSSVNISIGDTNMDLSSDRTYFVSKVINVEMKNTKDTYTVVLTNAPSGTIVKNVTGEVKTTFNKGEGFVVYVPTSSVTTETGSVSISVKTKGVTYNTYSYTIGGSYQDIAPVTIYEKTKSITSNLITLNFAKKTTKVKISKQDITSKAELPGAKLEILDANKIVVRSWTSSTTPYYIEGLPEGTYTLRETTAPAGYELSQETINFTLTANGIESTVVMYNAPEKAPTKYKISKQDITSKAELPGAKLEIRDKNNIVVDSWISGNTPHYVSNLGVGTYTLTETIAPDGYTLSQETITFTVQKDGKVETIIMYNAPENAPTKYKISKQDITSKEELPGAKLEIRDKNNIVVDSWTSGNTPHYVTNLKVGTYTLTETIAPAGYTLSKETITFTVQKDGKVKTVVMYNAKETTKVKISKQDITSKEELPGATLVIKDKNGKEVASWVSESTPHYIEGLNPGEYTLTETIAPKGYILSQETISFVVKADGKVTSVVMYNAKETKVTKVKISKQDITSKEELPGATLVIKDKDGKEVESWVSESTPHYIEGLNPGEYTLTETIAPKGYALSQETISFTIKDDGSVTSVVMYNARYTDVPITDLNVSTASIIGAAVLMLLGTGLVFYAKKSF